MVMVVYGGRGRGAWWVSEKKEAKRKVVVYVQLR